MRGYHFLVSVSYPYPQKIADIRKYLSADLYPRTSGLTVSQKKTETMFQSFPPSSAATATVMAGDTQLNPFDKFCYLSSYLANTITVDSDINSRLAKAGVAFGKLQRRLWSEHSVSLPVKVCLLYTSPSPRDS